MFDLPPRRWHVPCTLVLAIAALAACDRTSVTRPPEATRVRVAGIADAERGEVAGEGGAAAAMPTWTLPPGAVLGVAPRDGAAPLPPDAPVPSGAVDAGVIPQPTARSTLAVGAGGPPAVDPDIAALAQSVDPVRMRADITTLLALTAPAAGPATGAETRRDATAQSWLRERFAAIGAAAGTQLQAEVEPADGAMPSAVVATLPGIAVDKRIVYLTAELSGGGASAAASTPDLAAAATLLETARHLASRRWDATLRLVAFGDAQGRDASGTHAASARRIGLPIWAVFELRGGGTLGADGVTAMAPTVRVPSRDAGDGASSRLARHLEALSARYGGAPVAVRSDGDRSDGAGAAAAFADEGYAAVRVGEAPTPGAASVPDAVRLGVLARLAIVALANLALAPPALDVAPHVGAVAGRRDAVAVSWPPVDHASVAGYWVTWRMRDEQSYRPLRWVGTATEIVVYDVPAGDDLRIAVAPADDLGHLALFSPEGSP